MKRILETILITFVGGMLFTLLNVPLSWMLGPLAAVLLWTACTRRSLVWPIWLRNGGLLLLGYSMGLSFTLNSAKQISSQLPSMFIATLLTIAFSLGIAFITARQTGVNPASSAIGSIPGGLSQMIVLSEEIEGADKAVVAFMQTIRLLMVVFVIPFVAVHGLAADGFVAGSAGVGSSIANGGAGNTLVGSLISWSEAVISRPIFSCLIVVGVAAATWIAVKLRFPTAYFLGPILAAATFTVSGLEPPHLPSLFVLVAQWSLGIYMGLGIKLSSLSNWRRLLPYTILGNVAVIGFSIGLSYVFSLVLPMSLLTAFLGMSPGGMTEMGVTATLVGADVSLVVAYQMFRILFILFIVPYILRWGFRYFRRNTAAHSNGNS
ncbi:AbrB family transcriptional regulator [Paenibacillus sp. LMG 31456]|uniref:AbrB family transcriptional regulator n=1 Tax=Paenibacillus foliorum TaxID=2654974 RepID=A0A972GZR4_9BACL|nr:AbrB family transcriptional regulator [Paenibacillus foliorum]NOU97128.1 AbrB family transcriptional regulator [Paenibacillus foliorum]